MRKKQAVVRISKVFYTFHPDFIHDPDSPTGYKILNTGKWVVEWNAKQAYCNLPTVRKHYSETYLTEKEALAHVAYLESLMVDRYTNVATDDKRVFSATESPVLTGVRPKAPTDPAIL